MEEFVFGRLAGEESFRRLKSPPGPQAHASLAQTGLARSGGADRKFAIPSHNSLPESRRRGAIIPASARRRLAAEGAGLNASSEPFAWPWIDAPERFLLAGFLRVTGRILISIGPGPHRPLWKEQTMADSAAPQPLTSGPRAADPAPALTTYTLVTEPDQGLTPIYDLIASATSSIDMTMYELSDASVTSMLAAAAAKGIAVRVILDQNNEKSNNLTAYSYLAANQVSVHWANPVYRCTHQKTITVDQATSAIMTLNLVPEDYPTSRDFAVITNDPADIAAIEAAFNADFTDAAVTPPTGDNLVWSPTNSRSALLDLINGATTSLLIAQEEMDDAGLESALEAALARGVAVTLVQENLKGEYSAILNTLKSDGANIVTYSSRTGYYIHAKVILADYGTAQAALFIGSENFSTDSLNDNRELGLIFADPVCMAGIQAAITADFNGGTPF
jgi:phosphatidylserine/phosphatidylglycerophosphate/cardiolipin synthase-like enzyme